MLSSQGERSMLMMPEALAKAGMWPYQPRGLQKHPDGRHPLPSNGRLGGPMHQLPSELPAHHTCQITCSHLDCTHSPP